MKLLAATVISLSLLASASAQANQAGAARAALPTALRPGSADNHHHAKRVAALPAGTSRKLHGFRTRRSSVPGERSGTHVWRFRHVRAGCSDCMAHASAGQILIVTAGLGRVQRWGGPIEEIRQGDVVWIPPGLKHWHGASPNTAMTHIAIQEHLDGKSSNGWKRSATRSTARQSMRKSRPLRLHALPWSVRNRRQLKD